MVLNDAVYCLPEVIDELQGMVLEGLTVPEEYCLALVPVSRRYSVLDVGVGAGRTTARLSELFEKYVGIDYSDKLIAAATKLFPAGDLRVMDARRLDLRECFDCAMFSYNGIDYVDYEARQLILCQVANILRPGGYFIYSTHNLHWIHSARFLKRLAVKELFHPWPGVSLIVQLVATRSLNFWRQTGNQTQPYAYINDSAAGFRLLTTYVDIAREIEMLGSHGFKLVTTIGSHKRTSGYDDNDPWVYIVAKRP